LIVAGSAADDVARDITKVSEANSNVRLFLEFVNQNDIQKYLRAADLVILPYTQILNSGSAILALSFDRPILVPACGTLIELGEIVGPNWVRLYHGELDPDIIRAAVGWVKTRQIQNNAHAPLSALDWDRIAQLTIRAFS